MAFNTHKHSKIKFSLFFAMLIFASLPIFAFSLGELQEKLSETFSTFEDPNAGITGYRALLIPFGGKAESMGQAFTALSDDISFFEFNPAASSRLQNTELAVFHNAWIADSSVDTIAYTTRGQYTGFGLYGKFFYLPFTEYNVFGEDVSNGYYSESIVGFNLSHNFLAGYRFRGISVGFNAKAAYRSVPNYSSDETNKLIPKSGLNQSGIAVVGDLGVKSSFNFLKFFVSRTTNFNIGVSMNNIGIGFTNLANTFKLDSPVPTRLNAGFSWNILEPFTLAFEFTKPLNLLAIQQSEMWSASTGFSYAFTKDFSVEGGFLLKGANPKISLGSTFSVNSLVMNLCYTLDFTTSVNPFNRISFSAKANFGDKNRQEQQNKIDVLYSEGLTLYSAGYAEEAINKWKEILSYDKNFDPAIDAIKTTEATLELQRRIVEIQTLD